MDKNENIITSIEEEKKNKGRVNIYIDGLYSFSCSKDVVYIKSLKKGKMIDLEDIKDTIDEDNYIKCKNAALRVIEGSAKTEKEIQNKLLTKMYSVDTIERVIEFLKSYGFAGDRKYIQMYIRDKLKRYGRNKIKFILSAKGINQGLLSEMINDINPEDEISSARSFAQKKIKTINWKEDKRKAYKKLFDFLRAKGYTIDVIKIVLKDIFDENNLGGETY